MKLKTLNLNEFAFSRMYGLAFGLSAVTLIGYSDRCKGRGKGFISAHSMEMQFFVARASEQKDLTSITRKLKVVNSGTLLTFPLQDSLRVLSQEWCCSPLE